MKKVRSVGIVIGLVVFFASCSSDENHPGYNYFPDMWYSQAYETYMDNPPVGDSSMSAMLPVAGTVPRGSVPFNYSNSIDEYERAGSELTNPIERTDDVLKQGKHYYEIYCAVCHGTSGEGNGPIVERGVYPPPPSYFTDYMMELPEGKMFYSVHFGKNMMGSYAYALSGRERWMVIHYVRSLQEKQEQSSDTGDNDTGTDESEATEAETEEAGEDTPEVTAQTETAN